MEDWSIVSSLCSLFVCFFASLSLSRFILVDWNAFAVCYFSIEPWIFVVVVVVVLVFVRSLCILLKGGKEWQ